MARIEIKFLANNERVREFFLPDPRFVCLIEFGMTTKCSIIDSSGFTYETLSISKTNPRWTLYVDAFEKKAKDYYLCKNWSLAKYRDDYDRRINVRR